MAELKQIYSPSNSAGKPSVIFVHGLGGDISETWMCNGRDHSTLWPRWVGEDTGCPVWLLGYDAAISAWSEVAMALPAQGTSVLDTILSEPKLRGVPLVMVGHSLGGLVIKTALANAKTLGVARYEEFAEQLKGVVFLGTPHFGSELATLATAIRLLRPNEQVGNLKANDANLANLNAQFRNLHLKLGFKVRVFTETRGVTIPRRIFGIRVWPSKIVVAASSGDPHVVGEVAIPLPEDHFSICKPKDQSAQVHRSLIDFLREVQDAIASAGGSIATAPAANPGQPARDVAVAGHREPTPVYLAVGAYGIEATTAAMATCACVVTDEPQALGQRIRGWREQLSRDPLIPIGSQAFIASANLQQLVIEPSTRAKLLDWLAVTPFSAYVYYCHNAALADMNTRRERLLVEPLVHRFSKKDERVVRAQSNLEDIEGVVASALAKVHEKFHRTVETPQMSGKDTRSLIDLAQLVAWATAQHLERPDDGDATTLFQSLRTRIRFAQDVVTGERHLRDENPLA